MEEDYNMDLRTFWELLRKKLKFIFFITLISTMTTGILSYFVITPVYEGKTSIIIGKAPDQHNINNQYNNNADDIYMYQKLLKTYTAIAKSDLVTDKTAKLLNNGMTGIDIQKATNVIPKTDTQILSIKCQSKDPAVAQKMVEILVNTFIEESQRIYPTDNIKVMDEAKLPEEPVKPRKIFNMIIAFIIGLMGSIGIVILLDYMDNTIKTEEDVHELLNLPVLGMIPQNTQRI